MEKKHNIVYKIVNRVNENSYIGVHKTDNLADGYMGSGVVIKRAIAKYGIENFNKEVLFDFSTYQEALAKEKEIVDDEFLARSDTYNLRRGGTGGFDYINKTHKNRYPRTEEWYALMKIVNKDNAKKYWDSLTPEESRNKHRSMGIKSQKVIKKKYPNGIWKGRRHSEESKIKISCSRKGKQTTSTLGKHWFTNGEENVIAFECPEGWKKGRITT